MIHSRRLPDHLRPKLESAFLDIFIEKHEMWGGYFAKQRDCRIALLGSVEVLLPLTEEELHGCEALDLFKSPDGKMLTLFLADRNLDETFPGLLIVAEKLEGTGIFVAKFYHASYHVSKLWHERRSPAKAA